MREFRSTMWLLPFLIVGAFVASHFSSRRAGYGAGAAACLPWPSSGHIAMTRGQTLSFCAPCKGCVVVGVGHPVDPDHDPMGDVTSESAAGGVLSVTSNKNGIAGLSVMLLDPSGRRVGPYGLTVTVADMLPNV